MQGVGEGRLKEISKRESEGNLPSGVPQGTATDLKLLPSIVYCLSIRRVVFSTSAVETV